MPRRVFFSFHYEHDVWRVGQVRHSWIGQKGETSAFVDAASWEAVKRRGETAVKSWIDRQLEGTGVTVVLIGTYTSTRAYVNYEIKQSYRQRKGIVGIYIHGIKNNKKRTARKGKNPLDDVVVEKQESVLFFKWKQQYRLSDIFKTYDWAEDNGRENMPAWIEEAAEIAGR